MLEKNIEYTQEVLSELELAILNAGDRFETAIDNLGVSLPYNFSLFGFGAPVLWALGPGVALAVIYGGAHWYLERRYRDSWDAYLERERDRLDRIRQLIDKVNLDKLDLNDESIKITLIDLIFQLDAYAKDTEALSKVLGQQYIAALEATINEEKNKSQSTLERILGAACYQKYEQLKNNVDPSELLADKKSAHPNKNLVPQELMVEREKLAKMREAFSARLVNGALFNSVLSYALAYWLVYYFTVSTLKIAAITPLGWGLLALSFPIIYLIYEEYASYKKRILEKDISALPENEKEAEQIKRDSDLSHRYVWVVLALILSVAVGGIMTSLGLEVVPVLILSIASFVMSLGIVKLTQDRIDRSVENAQSSHKQNGINSNEIQEKINSSERRIRAATRRSQLDEIVLDSYKLTVESKTNFAPKNLDSLKRYELSQSEPKLSSASMGVKSRSVVPIFRLILSVALSALLGYALGNLLGLVAQDLLKHFTAFFSGTFGTIIVTASSLLIGFLFGQKAYISEKTHQNELAILSAQYSSQLSQLENLEVDLKNHKDALAFNENEQIQLIMKIREVSSDKELLQRINQVEEGKFAEFKNPVRTEGITTRKVLYTLRAFIQVLVAIATASLIVRGVFRMGFASLIPGLGDASLDLFGASINPIALVILGLVTAVLVLKIVNDLYLAAQKKEEIAKIERSGFDLKLHESEINYLNKRLDYVKEVNEELKQSIELQTGEVFTRWEQEKSKNTLQPHLVGEFVSTSPKK